MFLQESTLLERFEVLQESEGGEKTYRLRGVFSKAGVINKNNRIYSREIMEEAVEDANSLIKAGRFVGEIEHPSTPKINLERISHKITELKITSDGSVIGEMVPAGPAKNILIELLKDKINVGVSTRGVGSVKPTKTPIGESVLEVQRGYKMSAIDIVHDPSAGTFPEAVFESTEYSERSNIYAVSYNFKGVWNEVFNKGLK